MSDLAKHAIVYKNDQVAGKLHRDGPHTSFSYLPAYLASGLAPVASALPLTDTPASGPGGAIPAFFAGLLPEGRRLTNLRRTMKVSADDELSLLLAVGGDPVGDVSISPVGSVPSEPRSLATVKRNFNEILFAELLQDTGIIDPSALAGVQEKVSARMLSLPGSQSDRRFILKLDPPEFPQVVANEAYFIQLASKAGFPVVTATIVHDKSGRPGLLVDRFDRAGTRRYAVEDASQLLGLYPADKYSPSAEEVAGAVISVCSAKLVAAREVFRQFVFAWLTGNGDLHAKNISVVGTSTGEWRVAPTYDIPSTLPYGDSTSALAIAGHTSGLSRRLLLSFGQSLGLPLRAAEKTLDAVIAATATVADDWENGAVPVTPQATRPLVRAIRQRHGSAVG
jgi:serine/threonine-protein kinase HipA